MASKVKYVFATILAIQVTILSVYLVNHNSSIYEALTDILQVISSRILSNESPSEIFQPIGNNSSAWLYSAFYDHLDVRDGKTMVRMMGVLTKGTQEKVYCHFSSPSTSGVMSVGKLLEFPYSHGVQAPPAYVECSLPRDIRPTHVSVTFNETDTPTNRLQIIYPGPLIRNFTVCYSMLHSGFNKSMQLIENIEMNRLLGAEHFVVYNMSISQSVDEVLKRYQDDGIVTVLQWQILTDKSQYFAQMTSLNDCFYRSRNVSRFVVVMDTDEYFVPRHHSTFMEMIHSVSPNEMDISRFMDSSSHGQNLTACFMARSSYFSNDKTPDWGFLPQQFPFSEEEKKNVVKYKMSTLTQFVREKKIFPYEDRSKYLARPELVYTAGVHYVLNYLGPNKCVHIKEDQTLVHHYRVGNLKGNTTISDTSILHFKQSLYPRIMEQVKRFPKIFT